MQQSVPNRLDRLLPEGKEAGKKDTACEASRCVPTRDLVSCVILGIRYEAILWYSRLGLQRPLKRREVRRVLVRSHSPIQPPCEQGPEASNTNICIMPSGIKWLLNTTANQTVKPLICSLRVCQHV